MKSTIKNYLKLVCATTVVAMFASIGWGIGHMGLSMFLVLTIGF